MGACVGEENMTGFQIPVKQGAVKAFVLQGPGLHMCRGRGGLGHRLIMRGQHEVCRKGDATLGAQKEDILHGPGASD